MMRVSKWGNSLAVRLPAAVVDELGLKEGDEIGVRASEDGRELRVARALSKEEAIASLRKYRGLMPKDFKFNRDEANER
jgi:antitoxin MazE